VDFVDRKKITCYKDISVIGMYKMETNINLCCLIPKPNILGINVSPMFYLSLRLFLFQTSWTHTVVIEAAKKLTMKEIWMILLFFLMLKCT